MRGLFLSLLLFVPVLAQWPDAWQGGDMVKLVNKASNLCLVAWGGMNAGIGYRQKSDPHYPDSRFNKAGAAPAGLEDCGSSERMRDDRQIWRQVPHLSGTENVTSFLSQTRRGDEGGWPQLVLDYDPGSNLVKLAPVFATDAVAQNYAQQGWRQNLAGQLINNFDSTQCLTVIANDNVTCPNGCVWNKATDADEYFCCTGTTSQRLAVTNCSNPAGADLWSVESARFSLILVADVHGPTGCTTNEASPFLERMHANGPVHNRSVPNCGMVQTGKIFNQSVMVAATGIGMMQATSCVQFLLQHYHFNQAIFAGTAGFSGARGGVASSLDCSLRQPVGNPTQLGDVCVSHISRNYDAMESSLWDYRNNTKDTATLCDAGHAFPVTDAQLVGPGTLSRAPSALVSDAILDAARDPATGAYRPSHRVPVPNVSQTSNQLAAISGLFWDKICPDCAVRNFQSHTPHVYNYTECAEMTSYNYWNGVPEDDMCRTFTAGAINTALKANLTRPLSKQDVIGVTAMEGVAWMTAANEYNDEVDRWNGRVDPGSHFHVNSQNYQYPRGKLDFTNVRGMADYDHPPLCPRKSNSTQLEPCFSSVEWHRSMDEPKPNGDEWICAAYSYAGEMAARVVLRMLEEYKPPFSPFPPHQDLMSS